MKAIIAMSPKKSLRDSTGQAVGSRKKQVLVAMSGGIDSSVTAYLLKEQRYDVIGIYLKLWKESSFNDGQEKIVKAVAKKIGIPLKIIDARKEFKKKVVDYFLSEYQAGRTPNPCVVCNERIKFRFLFDKLAEFKADYVATGHYARKREIKNQKSKIKNAYRLYIAKDKNKDQSYFLYTLTQKQFSKILFPLGDYTKEEVKKLAKKYKLPVLDREESQNVCFIRDKYSDTFLKRHLKMKKGNIVDTNGNIIGKHEGLPLYTIGQRRGIKIGGTGPYFVVDKNLKNNTLIVTNNPKDPRLYKKSISVENVNCVANEPKFPFRALVRTRYRNPLAYAIIKLTDNLRPTTNDRIYKVEFAKPQRAVTAGQSAVFYGKNGEVLGGGIMKN